MHKPINTFCTLIVELLLVFYFSCSSPTGGGSDTEALTGVVVSINGFKTSGLAVTLYDTSFFPFRTNQFHTATITDEAGKFRFKSINITACNLVCIDSLHGMGCLIPNLNIESIKADSQFVCSLKTLSSVAGVIHCSDSILQKDVIKNGFVYINGSPFFSKINQNGGFSLNVPTGTFLINYCSVDRPHTVAPGSDSLRYYVGPEILLEPGSTSFLDTIDIKNWKIQ